MNITLQQIQELPTQERRQLSANINYYNSKEYFAHKRRKQIMTAITLIEQGVEDDKPTSITEGS